MKNQLIIITGPKHSGKTLCARALGQITGGEAADLDEIVEQESGKTPRELYKEGPEIFRKAEARALASVLRLTEQEKEMPGEQTIRQSPKIRIIASGGGLIDNPEALELLAKLPVPTERYVPTERKVPTEQEVPSRHGRIIVYLDVSAGTAWQRILYTAAGGELPPFLRTENPKETHLALHKRRAEGYKNLAQIIINAENKSPEEIAGEIAARLEKNV